MASNLSNQFKCRKRWWYNSAYW